MITITTQDPRERDVHDTARGVGTAVAEGAPDDHGYLLKLMPACLEGYRVAASKPRLAGRFLALHRICKWATVPAQAPSRAYAPLHEDIVAILQSNGTLNLIVPPIVDAIRMGRHQTYTLGHVREVVLDATLDLGSRKAASESLGYMLSLCGVLIGAQETLQR